MKFWRFRLYPERGSSLYVLAIVFEHRRDMLAFWKQCGGSERGRARAAEVRRYIYRRRRRPGRIDPKFAWVTFWRQETGVGYIAHEMFHATMYWAHRRGLKLADVDNDRNGTLKQDSTHERLALVHGELVRQFVQAMYKAGLYA